MEQFFNGECGSGAVNQIERQFITEYGWYSAVFVCWVNSTNTERVGKNQTNDYFNDVQKMFLWNGALTEDHERDAAKLRLLKIRKCSL